MEQKSLDFQALFGLKQGSNEEHRIKGRNREEEGLSKILKHDNASVQDSGN